MDDGPPAFGRVMRPLRAVFFCFFSFAPKEKKRKISKRKEELQFVWRKKISLFVDKML